MLLTSIYSFPEPIIQISDPDVHVHMSCVNKVFTYLLKMEMEGQTSCRWRLRRISPTIISTNQCGTAPVQLEFLCEYSINYIHLYIFYNYVCYTYIIK